MNEKKGKKIGSEKSERRTNRKKIFATTIAITMVTTVFAGISFMAPISEAPTPLVKLVWIDVDKNGAYNPPGDPAWSSIQDAIDNATDGDIIIADSATYNEDLVIDVPNLTIKSTIGKDSTTIQLKSNSWGIDVKGTADNFQLGGHGFTILSGATTNVLLGMQGGPSGVTITNNTFNTTGNANMAIAFGGAGVDDLTISGNTFTSEDTWETGIYVEGPCNNLVVDNNTCNAPSSDYWSWMIWTTVDMNHATIENNILNYGAVKINLGASDDTLRNVSFIDNEFNHADITITECKSGDWIENFLVARNNFTGPNYHEVGFEIWDSEAAGFDFDTIAIENNNFLGSFSPGKAVSNTITGTPILNAECNWWGDASGPGGEGPGTGENVSANVDYEPWLVEEYPPANCTGTNPVQNIDKEWGYPTIQDAIDDADPGNTITVAAGTYTENVVVNKELTIKAASSPIIDGQGMFGPAVHITADNVTFQGFTVKNFKATPTAYIGAILVEGDNAVIDNNIIEYIYSTTGNPAGIGIDVHAKNVKITNNTVHDVGSIGIRVRDHWKEESTEPPTESNNVLIENNKVYRTNNTGVLVTGFAKGVRIINNNEINNSLEPTDYNLFVHCGASDVLIEDNNIHNTTHSNIVLGGCDNVTISSNTIKHATKWNILIVNDYLNCSGDINLLSTNITITNNDLDGKHGVGIYSTATDSTPMASTTTINYNDIVGNTVYGVENTIGTNVNATLNWWGDVDGPNHISNPNYPTDGDNVSDNVDYCPWLNASIPGGVATGPVIIQRTGLGYCTIQDAIDNAIDGDIIIADSATYNEDLVIDVPNLTIKSTIGKDSTTIQLKSNSWGIDVKGTADNFQLGGHGFTILSGATTNVLLGMQGGPSGVTITNNTFNTTGNANMAIAVGSGGADDLTISHNTFDLYGWTGIYFDCDPITDLLIDSNIVNGHGCPKWINWVVDAGADGAIISNNTVYDANVAMRTAGRTNALNNVTYTGNTIEGGYIAIGPSPGNANIITNLSITQNNFTGPAFEQVFFEILGSVTAACIDFTTLTVQYNNFDAVAGEYAIKNGIATTLDAELNYWGTNNGPEHSGNTFNVGSQGGKVTDNVDYVRWWKDISGTPGSYTGTAFAPVEASSYYSSIQAAIDAASSGTTITCQDGTFTEDLVIDVPNLTIKSTIGKDSTTIQLKSNSWGIDVKGTADNFQLGGHGFTILSGGSTTRLLHMVNGPSGVTITNNTFNSTGNPNMAIAFGGAGVDDLTISGNTFTSEDTWETGIYVEGPCNNLVVDNNTCNAPSSDYWSWMIWTTVDMNHATIENNILNYGAVKINLGASDDTLRNVSFIDNEFNHADITITECKSGDWIENFLVARNNFTGPNYHEVGFEIWDSEAAGFDFDTIAIENNNFLGSFSPGKAVSNTITGTPILNAECNWWGDASGPGGEGPGTGENVSANVDYCPWLDAAYPGGSATGPLLQIDLTGPAYNMVSISVELCPGDNSKSAVFGGRDVYTWDPVTGGYTTPTTIEIGRGYWVYSWINDTIQIYGKEYVTHIGNATDGLQLYAGYNMIGSLCNNITLDQVQVLDPDPQGSIANLVYWWNPETGGYDTGTDIITNRGYWLYAWQDCEIRMYIGPGPSPPL